jgi:hypothetical protein
MNKIIYTLGFLLVFSFFNNNAKAQTSPDVAPCTLVGGLVDAANQILAHDGSTGDQTCDTSGATNLTLELYNLGFCTAAPTIKFPNTTARDKDQRDRDDPDNNQVGTNSDFSNCVWTIKQSTTTNEVLDSVGDVEPLPVDEIPPAGTYTHAIILISNQQKITGTVSFAHDVNSDGTSATKGTKCWTDGSFFVDTGKEGPLIGTSIANAKANRAAKTDDEADIGSAGNVRNGATCGSTPNPTANTVIAYYSNHEGTRVAGLAPRDTSTNCANSSAVRSAGCNTTRSEESTSFGSLTVYFTYADTSTLTGTPNITRALIVSGQTLETDDNAPGNNNGNYGTGSNTNSLLGVFQFNTPMVVTSKTTGIEIYTNFSGALSVDFEPIQENNIAYMNVNSHRSAGVAPPAGTPAYADRIYNKNKSLGPRLKALQTGPFGIQFKPVEGGSTE